MRLLSGKGRKISIGEQITLVTIVIFVRFFVSFFLVFGLIVLRALLLRFFFVLMLSRTLVLMVRTLVLLPVLISSNTCLLLFVLLVGGPGAGGLAAGAASASAARPADCCWNRNVVNAAYAAVGTPAVQPAVWHAVCPSSCARYRTGRDSEQVVGHWRQTPIREVFRLQRTP